MREWMRAARRGITVCDFSMKKRRVMRVHVGFAQKVLRGRCTARIVFMLDP